MSEAYDYLNRFASYSGVERLESVLQNPEDKFLFCDLLWKTTNHKRAGLSAIWAFAMTKGGALAQQWHAGETWERTTVDDHPDDFFPDTAFEHLHASLRTQEDRTLLLDLRVENNNLKCPDPTLWAMFEFAVAKAEESSWRWRLERTSALGLESVEARMPAIGRLWAALRGSHRGLLSHPRNQRQA